MNRNGNRTNNAVLAVATVTALLAAASCSRRDAAPAPTPAPAVASVAATPPTPPNGASTTPARGTLAERLADEVSARPAAGLTVDAVAAALRRAGVAVTPPTQVLARTIGARYCASTSTPAGLALAVCEFGDAAEAERGLAYSHRTFDRLVPGRTLLRNRGTVLTMTPSDDSATLAADASRASAVFAAL